MVFIDMSFVNCGFFFILTIVSHLSLTPGLAASHLVLFAVIHSTEHKVLTDVVEPLMSGQD